MAVCRRTQFQGKKVNGNISSHPITGSEMTDLATLRELPRRESFVQQNNAIYGVGDGDVDQELALLPHIRFEDLLITKFLGRGAFGEVFEGTACNLPGSNQYHTKVAVKVRINYKMFIYPGYLQLTLIFPLHPRRFAREPLTRKKANFLKKLYL